VGPPLPIQHSPTAQQNNNFHYLISDSVTIFQAIPFLISTSAFFLAEFFPPRCGFKFLKEAPRYS